MIRLNVDRYCQTCSEFEPVARSYDLYENDSVYFSETLVTCKHEERCQNIYQTILRDITKREESNP